MNYRVIFPQIMLRQFQNWIMYSKFLDQIKISVNLTGVSMQNSFCIKMDIKITSRKMMMTMMKKLKLGDSSTFLS